MTPDRREIALRSIQRTSTATSIGSIHGAASHCGSLATALKAITGAFALPERKVGDNGLRPDYMRVHRNRAGVGW
jgi:hypothetical protein